MSPTSSPRTSEQGAAALEQAAALEADGRCLEAVETLLAANRANRDGRIEQELVRLRLAAFDELDRTQGRPSWPPAMDDPFPDVTDAAPEVPASELTPEILGGALTHHGSLLVRGVLSAERCAELQRDIERSFHAFDTRSDPDEMPAEERARWYKRCNHDGSKPSVFGLQGTMRVIDSPAVMFDVIEAFHDSGLLSVFHGYFGERPALSNNKWAVRRTRGRPVTDLHQDGAFLGDDIRTVNTWLSLTHAGGGSTSAPGIEVVPQRMPGVLPTGTHGAAFHWTVSPDGLQSVVPGAKLVCPEVFPGDALLFDEMLMHRTEYRDHMNSDWRWAVESWFFAPSCYPERYAGIVV